MSNQTDQLFHDEEIQRFDADTIKNRYGDSWRNFATNVREVTQPDGSIVKEYFIEDPSLLEEMKPSSTVNNSDDDQRQPLKNRFAQIKAKFEQNNFTNVMASPSTSSAVTSNTSSTRQNSRKQMDDLYARHRRGSNESIPVEKIINDNRNYTSSSNHSTGSQNSYHRSQSIDSDKSKLSSFRRFNSADEADEEVSRIHRQGEELRRQNPQLTPISSVVSNDIPEQSRVQYEIVDEDGNPMEINGVQNLIKMSGVRAREVPQPDGTVVKEYVIDDPQLLSQFRSQQQDQDAPVPSSYTQQRSIDYNAPPPPPRIPLRPPLLFRPSGSSMNDNTPYDIQQIRVLEPQRRYEYLTSTGRRVQFAIMNSNNFNKQPVTDADIRELTNAINLRVLPSSTPVTYQQQQQQQQPPPPVSTQISFNLPKPWYPSVDISQRQRTGSDTEPYSNNTNTGFQRVQSDLSRSASSGALNQTSYHPQNHYQQQQQPVYNPPPNNWNTYRPQNSHNQRQQNNEPFQTSAQFLPQQQRTRSTHSPPMNYNQSPAFQQQSTNYPYQGQQQHGVRIFNDYNQQRTAMINDGQARI